MRKIIVLLGLAVALLMVSGAFAADKPGEKKGPKVPRVVGTVAVTKENNEVKTVTITTGKGEVYNVTLDDNGKKLAAEMDGKKVQATGTIEEKDGKKTITVQSYKEHVPRKKEPAK